MIGLQYKHELDGVFSKVKELSMLQGYITPDLQLAHVVKVIRLSKLVWPLLLMKNLQ